MSKGIFLYNFLREHSDQVKITTDNYFRSFFFRFFAVQHHLPFIDDYYLFIKSALKKINIPIPEKFTLENFHRGIQWLARKNKYYKGIIVNVFFKYQDNQTISIISLEKRKELFFETHARVFVGEVYSYYKCLSPWADVVQDPWLASYLDTNKFYDFFIKDAKGNIVDAYFSNFLIIKNEDDILFSKSPLRVRRVITEKLLEWIKDNYNLIYKDITEQDILEAQEIVLVNEVDGIVPVKGYKQARYMEHLAPKLLEVLNQIAFNQYTIKKD